MFFASSLNDPVPEGTAPGGPAHDGWREAEAAAFSVMERLRRGQVPSLDGASPAALRRLGYLAETVLLLLDPADPGALERLAGDLRHRLAGAACGPPVPAVPHGAARRPERPVRFDDIGAAWNVAPGISLARYRAEAPALRAGRAAEPIFRPPPTSP